VSNYTDQKIWNKKKESTPTDASEVMTVSDPYNQSGTLDSYRKNTQARSTIAAKYKTEQAENELFTSKTPK